MIVGAGSYREGRATCGCCGRTWEYPALDPSDVRDRANRDGWRFCGEWGACCPTCALGTPGLYYLKGAGRMKVQVVERDAQDRTPVPEVQPSHVRGFGWRSFGGILKQMLPGLELEDAPAEDRPGLE